VFQSTHPHGVRHNCVAGWKYEDAVSIHAPARGATQLDCWIENLKYVSIHAPVRGATCLMNIVHMFTLVSIHAPARGATYFR